MASGKIHTRGLTSFFTLFGFIIMAITGLVLYVEPAGRVAYWTTWSMLGLTKTQWGNIHILSSILFIIAGGVHIYLNWKPLMNYFKDKARRGVKLRRELAISSVLSVWVVVSAIWPFPPLSYLLDFNTWLKDVWVVQNEYEPPFGHAELQSLKTFTTKMDINLARATAELKANGIKFSGVDETLETIAERNDIAPMELYLMIKKFEPEPEPEKLGQYTPETIEVEFAGTGIGNKSIGSVCLRLGLDTTTAASRLRAVGITPDMEMTMKATAETIGTEAIEIMKAMLIEGYQPERSETGK
ncbi:MAG TPA: DUF4405 domain-containing protein [candidate division Zixibacteria bacterium]|nr:DUF4405 domain-containing protein [candidate division Zixibacteria bacterium]